MVITTIGIIAMLTASILQALLVFDVMKLEQTLRTVLVANAVSGAWMVINGILARASSRRGEAAVPQGLAWLA